VTVLSLGTCDVQVRFYRDGEVSADALELFALCGTQGGRLTASDNHIDVYCHGGWGMAANGSVIHCNGIETNTGRPWTSQNNGLPAGINGNQVNQGRIRSTLGPSKRSSTLPICVVEELQKRG
jgi:hypothetical protein